MMVGGGGLCFQLQLPGYDRSPELLEDFFCKGILLLRVLPHNIMIRLRKSINYRCHQKIKRDFSLKGLQIIFQGLSPVDKVFRGFMLFHR